MSINANNKILDTVLSRIDDYKIIFIRDINDLKEIKSIMKKGLDIYNSNILKIFNNFSNAKVTEVTYENGLKFLKSEVTYSDEKTGNHIHTITQYVFISDYENEPLINIYVQKRRKSIQQLLINSFPNEQIITESERNIEILNTIPYLNSSGGSVFTEYTNIRDNSLLLEKYTQGHSVSDSDQGLLFLCRYSSIEIIYSNKQPLYANFSGANDGLIAGYDSNTKEGAQFAVDTINGEVDAIVEKINSIFDNYEKEYNYQKRLKK